MTDKVKKRVLFLGYSSSETKLLDELRSFGCEVIHTSHNIDTSQTYDFVVSFGYRYILSQHVISILNCPIFNLHISYLPYNRGAHPNFWSFFDGTPAGVTLHLIDKGIDTGPVVEQRRVRFSKDEDTFVQTHKRLIFEVEELFILNIKNIMADNWSCTPQTGVGTNHTMKELPEEFSGWHCNIKDEITRLKNLQAS